MKLTMDKRFYRLVGILAVLGVSGALVFNMDSLFSAEADVSKGQVTALYTVEQQVIEDKTDYPGTLTSLRQVTLASKISSNVTQRNFDEGDFLKEGEVILVLDASNLEARLETLQKKRSTLEGQGAIFERTG
ncbi:MAG: hypothetical protein AVO33_01860 [delta proteobacterium ML8_F1]|nr:MAG: hypothetical protein AVO33_01860 [delta proteobacterium ML8_F1]